jgi:glycosyltransferase involved in cell wall biosynthesis
MNVAVDSTPLAEGTGGLCRYTRELSRALAARFPEDRVTLLSDQAVAGGRQGSWLTRRWWSVGLPLELMRIRADVFHGTDFAVPYVPVCPSVLTLHDLSPWRDDGRQTGAGRVRQRTPVLLKLRLATMVITPSEAIRKEALARFQLPLGRVVSVPLAAGAAFSPEGDSHPGFGKPYFLFVGTLEPRKNLPMLVEAWQEVRREFAVDLLLAGRRRPDCPPLPQVDGLRWLGPVKEEDLPALYRGALACVYPSFYEGFGLPVLEAMQCGCAVMTSRDPAISEVAGNAALLLPATDTHAWAAALRAAARNSNWLRFLKNRAVRQASGFSWERAAERTREVYLEARKRFGL